MADQVIQAQDTFFSRSGNQFQQRWNNMPDLFPGYIDNSVTSTPVNPAFTTAEYSHMAALVQEDQNNIGGGQTLLNIQNTTLSQLLGMDPALKAIYSIDPFGTDYETATEALYDRSFAIAMAHASSGPQNVRGGTARQGFENAELGKQMSINRFREIWQNQMAMTQYVITGAQTANSIQMALRDAWLKAQAQQAQTEHGRTMEKVAAAEQLLKARESHLHAITIAGELRCIPTMSTTDQYTGKGFQHGNNSGFGYSIMR